ncbi:MAG: hypothetical protein OXS35_00205 [Dehalococcoidia bacterium]|nr:hypothetical protein [Dehalococcoidia bacterium]
MSSYQRETRYGERISFTADPKLRADVVAAAVAEKASVAAVVRRCIEYALPKLREQRRSKARRARSQQRSG